MMDLAAHETEGNVTLREIASRQGISEKYLWQVVNPLKKSGLIRAAAGPGGGYALARTAATITLRDILAVLEGGDTLVACDRKPLGCPRSSACAARDMWREVEEKIAWVLTSVTLRDLGERQRAMTRNEAASYAI
jgi:Rrf2 family protein